MKKKIAYLFLTYSDLAHPDIWERYFASSEGTASIYLHAANREEVNTHWLKDKMIYNWVSTGWGKIGLVIAQMQLLEDALKDPENERFVLVSNSCLPIKSYKETYDILFSQSKSWVHTYCAFTDRLSKVTNINKKDFRKNSQWVMLNRPHARMITSFNYISDFTHAIIPDEHYVGTVLTHLGQENSLLQREQTDVRWTKVSSVQMTPVEYDEVTKEQIRYWKDSRSLFARKFLPESNIGSKIHELIGD